MPKKRVKKILPEHLTMIPAIPDDAPLADQLKTFFRIHNRHIEWVEVCRQDFENVGNPLSAWDGYAIARKSGQEIPGWVLEYFDMVAKRMLRSYNSAKDLPDILGFQPGWGGPGEFKQYLSYQAKRTAVAFVTHLLNSDPETTIDAACDEAASYINKRWPGAGKARNAKSRGGKGHTMIDGLTVRSWYYEK